MTSEKNINFEIVLDRIIEVTEKNLTMQSEFLKAIYELKGRFDSSDRDHGDMAKNVELIVNNSFEMLNNMKSASNEKIIEMLQKSKDSREKEQGLFIDTRKDIKNMVIKLNTLDSKKLDDIADSYGLIKKLLIILSIGVLGFQLIFGIFNSFRHSSSKKDVMTKIEKIVK